MFESTSVGSSPGTLVTGKSQVADWLMPFQEASSVSLFSTRAGITRPVSALTVSVTLSRNGITRDRSSVIHDRPGTSRPSKPPSGELPNSLTAWTVTLAASGNGLNRRSSRVNPSAVMPPTRCHTFGTDTTHRSPVNSSSVHIVLDTTAGPSSNSTIPGVGPRRASSAVSTLLASGPRSTKGSVSGSSVGLELGRVINASTSTAVPTS